MLDFPKNPKLEFDHTTRYLSNFHEFSSSFSLNQSASREVQSQSLRLNQVIAAQFATQKA